MNGIKDVSDSQQFSYGSSDADVIKTEKLQCDAEYCRLEVYNISDETSSSILSNVQIEVVANNYHNNNKASLLSSYVSQGDAEENNRENK